MPPIADLAIAAALAWGSGIRLYATLFLVGIAGHYGWIELPQHLTMLQSPLVLAASGFMSFIEFFADKFTWVDSVWDAVHTFIRIPAGAALAAAVFGDAGAGTTLAAAILGGTVAGGTHLSKAGARAMINTSPEPFSNWAASITEDAALPAGLWLASAHPLMFLLFLVTLAVIAIVLIRWIVKGLLALLGKLRTPRPA
ncbi:MAG: DUF4126 domain-containing protein [Burkholderiales bacterium]